MKNAKLKVLTALFLLLPLFNGCFWTPEFSDIVAEIERQAPEADFRREIQLNLGPASIGLARTLLGLAPDEREIRLARDILRDVQHIKIAVYETYNLRSARQVELPNAVAKMIEKHHWKTAVRAHEDDEFVMAVYKQHRQSIAEMFVLSLDRNELVLVQVDGRLDKLFKRVMEEHADVGDIFISGR